MARRFVSSFIIQTNAIFNISKLNMPLSILVGVTNTMTSFPLAYTFIYSKSIETFKFVNICCKKLFFWDDYPGPVVIMGVFSLSLLVVMVKNVNISIVEGGINQAYKLVNHLNALGKWLYTIIMLLAGG